MWGYESWVNVTMWFTWVMKVETIQFIIFYMKIIKAKYEMTCTYVNNKR